ncbi:MAG: hypothetical protein F6J93_05355 [Oscillatoria sp. SIO1A7]|nr:hypothetical protein [Oscillatoria sp. SIO1A7]
MRNARGKVIRPIRPYAAIAQRNPRANPGECHMPLGQAPPTPLRSDRSTL